jgi:hypothetical protein
VVENDASSLNRRLFINEFGWIRGPRDESLFSTMTSPRNTFERITSESGQVLGLFHMKSIKLTDGVKKLANVQNIGNLSKEYVK